MRLYKTMSISYNQKTLRLVSRYMQSTKVDMMSKTPCKGKNLFNAKPCTKEPEEPFVIVIKSDTIQTRDLEIKITAYDPCDAIMLAAHVVALYKDRFKCDPIIEIQP